MRPRLVTRNKSVCAYAGLMTVSSPTSISADDALANREVAALGLEAQLKLLPYALGFFGICLPVFVLIAAHAPNGAWMGLSLGLYAFNWAVFYAIADWHRRRPLEVGNLRLRTAVHMGAGLLWAVAVLQTAFLAMGAGPFSEILLVLCAGAAVGVIFFCAPSLPNLLVVGPAAAVGPIVGLYTLHGESATATLVLSALALAMALALILNRHLREHFALAIERERLFGENEIALRHNRLLAKSRSDILATLSREVRHGLSGVAQVLAAAMGAGTRGAPSRDKIDTALSSARSLVEVLDATLDNHSAEQGQLVIARQEVDVGRIIQELLLHHARSASAKGLTLSSDVRSVTARTRGGAIGDRARVRQILHALLSNAIAYTARGRIEVRASLPEPTRLRIEIIDTGPGLTREELVMAFTPFTRIERTSAGLPGAGLGLALSRKLAELMGGRLEAESSRGIGSRFILEMPFDPEAEVDTTFTAPLDLSERPLKVVMIEADPLSGAMLKAVLEQLDHQVLSVKSLERATELLRAGRPDVMLVSTQADASDIEAFMTTVQSGRAPMPVIAVIESDGIDAAALEAMGFAGVIFRPVTLSGVTHALEEARRRVIEQARQASERAA